MKIHNYKDGDFDARVAAVVDRSNLDFTVHDETVRQILAAVRKDGDKALLEYTRKFDHNELTPETLRVSPEEMKQAYAAVDQKEIDALRLAAENIRKFHQRQTQESWRYEEEGVLLGQQVRALETVGIYVPGGKASYPSSVLMNAIPARVAGVDRVVMVSPSPRGESSPHAFVAADLAGVDEIYKVGGAQAVAALAFGTQTLPRVDKIVGPGNIYVALAKRMVFGMVDIDMIAGPSEILIVADDSANPEYVAADLLSQAEHDEEAVPILVTPSSALAGQVVEQLQKQKETLGRKRIVEASLKDQCRAFVVSSLAEAVDLANRMAPEHLELAVEDPEHWADKIRHAGAVFLGHFTPEALGDYLAGPNHVLPTSGTARFSSPLGVYDFIKRTSIIGYTKEALQKISGQVEILAGMEDLDAHARAVKKRVKKNPPEAT